MNEMQLEYLRGFRDGARQSVRDELYPIIEELMTGMAEAFKVVPNMLIDNITIEAVPKNWIPCSEKLPEDFVKCLVCMSDGCIRLGKWNGEYDEQGVWWVSHPNSGGKLYRIKNVPYWMPLPEPPEVTHE